MEGTILHLNPIHVHCLFIGHFAARRHAAKTDKLISKFLPHIIQQCLTLSEMQHAWFLLLSLVSLVYGQIPCDDAYGQFCAEESGFGVGDCLKKQSTESLGEGCLTFMQMHDICRADIQNHCPGKEYTGDALGSQFCVIILLLLTAQL